MKVITRTLIMTTTIIPADRNMIKKEAEKIL
jgi:hypothetical protein